MLVEILIAVAAFLSGAVCGVLGMMLAMAASVHSLRRTDEEGR